MAVRNIVKIDEDKCTGCGQCVTACAEGAIQIIDGKARLVSDSYCDGLGACLGHCPEDAITIERREAPEFDEEAVEAHLRHESKPVGGAAPVTSPQTKEPVGAAQPFVCPGLAAQQFEPRRDVAAEQPSDAPSQLTHWPVQLKLVSPTAQCFADADLLLTADCVPLAVADFHRRFLKGRAVAVGCPKLDDASLYVEKFADILGANDVRSLTVVHMEVPCCSGLTRVAREAILRSGKAMNYEDVTISIRGEILARETVVMEGRSEATTVDHA
ncbi:MAG: 4Fe-4S binding protein [Sedimentisphaerales bacterium]|nr:4Fe-4S binding protein [Sedimentisphaerales bacterium]